MGIHRIETVVEKENRASAWLPVRLGFHPEGTRRKCALKNRVYIDLGYFALLNPAH